MTAKPGPRVVLEIARFVLGAVARFWLWLPLPILLGVAGTVAAAHVLGSQSWESSGVMIYSPLPVSEAQRGLFPQPELPTLVTLVRSPAVLDALRKEFNLEVPLPVLEKAFKVTSTRNTETITVSLQWAEPQMAADLTNRLMELFVDLIRTFRRAKASDYLTDFETRLAKCDAQHASAAKAYHDYFRKHNLFDAKEDIEIVRRENEALLYSRSIALQNEPALRSKRDRVVKDLSELRQQEARAAEEAKKFDAAQDNVTDARRRQDRLRELIEDEKQRQALMVELTAKRKEHEKRLALYQQGAESKATMDALATEIEVLTTRLMDSASVKKWKDELAEIDKVVVPNSKAPRQGSPIVTQTLLKQLDLDLELVGLEKQLFETDRQLAANRKRQEQLRTLVTEAEGLEKEMTARSAERLQLSDQVVLFRRLRDQGAGEFSIISRATPAPYPAGSNRKLIYIAGLGGTIALAIAVACIGAWRAQYHGGRDLASRCSIPVVVEVDNTPNAERQLVTELRRWQPGYGTALVWIDPSPESGRATPVFDRLVKRLVLRDERVLVLDCRLGSPAASALPGLADVLTFRTPDWEELLRSGTAAGVDVLPSGHTADPDLLGGHLLRQIVADAARRYSLVLLVASHGDDGDTLNSLMAVANGAVVHLGQHTSYRPLAGNLKSLLHYYPDRIRAVVDRGKSRLGRDSDPIAEVSLLEGGGQRPGHPTGLESGCNPRLPVRRAVDDLST